MTTSSDLLPPEPFEDPSWTEADQEAHLEALLAEPRSLLDADPESLTHYGRVEMLVQIQQAASRLAALEARALTAAAGLTKRTRRVDVYDEESERRIEIALADEAREEIAAALRLSPGQVHDRLAMARLLQTALPTTGAALESGRITAQHARVICEQARRFDGYDVVLAQDPSLDSPSEATRRAWFVEACTELERRVVPVAERTTPSRTRTAARRAVASIDTSGEERRRQQARRSVDVHLVPLDDGLALLEAWLPAEDAARVHAAIDAQARSAVDSPLPIGERRAQALVDAVCGDGGPATVRTEIQVVIDLASLVGASQEPGMVRTGCGPAQTMTAQAVRDLLADPGSPTSLRRMVTDPTTGHLLDRGRRAYAVTGPLRDYLVARDHTCRFPGCSRAAARSQVDHAIPWERGCATDRVNLGHLCTRHHQLKTHCEYPGGCSIRGAHRSGAVQAGAGTSG